LHAAGAARERRGWRSRERRGWRSRERLETSIWTIAALQRSMSPAAAILVNECQSHETVRRFKTLQLAMGLELRWPRPREARDLAASGLTSADDARGWRPGRMTPGFGGMPAVSARDVTPKAGCGEAGLKPVVGPPALQSPLQTSATSTARPADTLHRCRLARQGSRQGRRAFA